MIASANPNVFEVTPSNRVQSGDCVAAIPFEAVTLADDFEAASTETEGEQSLYLSVKVVVEWVVALALLVVSSPLLIGLGLLVRLTSSGPAIYAQTRLGLNGRRYKIYKLRTMVHNAEAKTGPVWASLAGDVRITPIGKILRATHMDELPQLWNVLRGEMGLIGPRPERPEIAARIERKLPDYGARLAVRPGVTGLAQMLLPADDPTDPTLSGVRKKLAADLYYIRNAGPRLDLAIAVATPCHFAAAAVSALGRAAAGALQAVRKGVLRRHAAELPIGEGGLDIVDRAAA